MLKHIKDAIMGFFSKVGKYLDEVAEERYVSRIDEKIGDKADQEKTDKSLMPGIGMRDSGL